MVGVPINSMDFFANKVEWVSFPSLGHCMRDHAWIKWWGVCFNRARSRRSRGLESQWNWMCWILVFLCASNVYISFIYISWSDLCVCTCVCVFISLFSYLQLSVYCTYLYVHNNEYPYLLIHLRTTLAHLQQIECSVLKSSSLELSKFRQRWL